MYEINKALEQMKGYAAPGKDGITMEFIKEGDAEQETKWHSKSNGAHEDKRSPK